MKRGDPTRLLFSLLNDADTVEAEALDDVRAELAGMGMDAAGAIAAAKLLTSDAKLPATELLARIDKSERGDEYIHGSQQDDINAANRPANGKISSNKTARKRKWTSQTNTRRRVFGTAFFATAAASSICFLIWAHYTVLDEVARGQARVISSSQIQLIQNREDAILADVMVREGDVVEKGQVLLRIDNTRAILDLGDLRRQYLYLLAAIARLESEIAGKAPSEIEFPPELTEKAPGLVEAERKQAEIRRDQLDNQIGILQQQLVQKQQELESYVVKLKNVKRSLGLAQQQLKIKRPLAEQGVISQVELLQAQQDVNELQTELDTTQSAIPQTEAQVKEQENRLNEHMSTFRSEAADELSKHRAELASVQEQLRTGDHRVKRTEVRSPTRGMVKEIKIRTIGGVIRPDEDLMEIVPIEDTLLVEAQINARDFGFLHVGQKAVVKLDSHDYATYGELAAVIESIGSDVIEETVAGKRERFLHVQLRTDKNYLEDRDGKRVLVRPGDTATVDIVTGQKTVLQYLMLPILRMRDAAVRSN